VRLKGEFMNEICESSQNPGRGLLGLWLALGLAIGIAIGLKMDSSESLNSENDIDNHEKEGVDS